jgi:acyl-homoserine lactone acylase PvdQ
MDRQLKKPRNTPWLRFRWYALLTVGLFALVFGVGALPVAFIYFVDKVREAPSGERVGRDPASQMARQVTIYRDTYGVPHIYAPTDAACVFGLMYAQAEDNFWRIARCLVSETRFYSARIPAKGPEAIRPGQKGC